MLAPRCEEESAEAVIRELGLRSIALWRETYPGTVVNGSLVVAPPRDHTLLDRFARMTHGSERLDGDALAELEPDLGKRFTTALYYPGEAHLAPDAALDFLLLRRRAAGARLILGEGETPMGADLVIDCRGLAAKRQASRLCAACAASASWCAPAMWRSRGPCGCFTRAFRSMPCPGGDGLFMIGATVVESEETGPGQRASALELLSAAYALDPAFGEAEIVELGAGARPAFPDNRPRIITAKGYIYVNGLYRHGFLLAPALAELVAHLSCDR